MRRATEPPHPNLATRVYWPTVLDGAFLKILRNSLVITLAAGLFSLVVLHVVGCGPAGETARTARPNASPGAAGQTVQFVPVPGQSKLDEWVPPWDSSSEGEIHPPTTAPKWIVLTWDGATWDIALSLIDAGKMPHLASVMRRGVFTNLETIQPTESPLVWTTVATGMGPEAHGIQGFIKAQELQTLNTAGDRKVKAVWNILTELEKEVLVVGFHNTFPAERVSGMMISNYLMYRHSFERSFKREAEMVKADSRLVYPVEYLDEVLAYDRSIDTLGFGELHRFADWSADDFEREMKEASQRAVPDRTPFTYLRKAYLFDTINAELAFEFHRRLGPDLLLLHFQSLDWSSHYFLYHHWPAKFAQRKWPAKAFAALNAKLPTYQGTIAAFYEYADEWLGRFLSMLDADTGVSILSDHGFEPSPGYDRTGFHDNAPPGIFVASGPGIRSRGRIGNVSVYDVLPTLFTLMNLDVARDWRGQPLSEVVAAPTGTSRIRYVDTYQTPEFAVPQADVPDEVNEELLDQLRSLGYIR